MIRIVALLLFIVALWLALLQAIRLLKNRDIDWTGVVFVVGFVVLAFWLRGATGLG